MCCCTDCNRSCLLSTFPTFIFAMKKRGNEATFNATVKWFFVTSLFLACVLWTVIYKEELETIFGVRNDEDSCANFKQEKRSPMKKVNVKTYKKYTIEPPKLDRLDSMLTKMMKSNPRPDDEHFGYNVTRSDQIPVWRDVVDARPLICRNRKFNYSSFPTVSIISPFYNEALTPLVRHVHALLTRTPPRILVEIILIDDQSTFDYLGKDLEEYFTVLDSRIRLLRNEERIGLIMSRLKGSDVARGEVLVFLDAHMEVNHGWLEPLLERIINEEQIIVQSDITPILADTFHLDTGMAVDHRGGFGWDLSYLWFPLPLYLNQFKRTEWDPVPFPVIQGGSIAVRKSFFESLGRFDSGLEIWGGEHFEISFNVWMTGGRIEIVPCSKVGHIFKDTKYSFGIKEKNYVVVKNNLRVAEVWMDDYKQFTRAALKARYDPEPVFTAAEWKSIEERRSLRSKRQSKSFTWYLRSVLPEQPIPSADDILFGQIGSTLSRQCVYVTDIGFLSMTPSCKEFAVVVGENTFAIDRWQRMKHGDKCVGLEGDTTLLKLVECPCVEGGQATPYWTANADGELIYHGALGPLCATLVRSLHGGQEVVQLQTCVKTLAEQKWAFMYHFKK